MTTQTYNVEVNGYWRDQKNQAFQNIQECILYMFSLIIKRIKV